MEPGAEGALGVPPGGSNGQTQTGHPGLCGPGREVGFDSKFNGKAMEGG